MADHIITLETAAHVAVIVEEHLEKAHALATLLMNGLAAQCETGDGLSTLWRTAQVLAEDVLGSTALIDAVRQNLLGVADGEARHG